MADALIAQPEPKDIGVEDYRTYHYGNGTSYTIRMPSKLYITADGGHRVVDKGGITHCPSRPWNAITWTQKDGKPFAF